VIVAQPYASTADDRAEESAPAPGSGRAGWPPGDPEATAWPARDVLVERYAHLVKFVVGRLGVSVPGVFDHDDAMQAGTIGLLRAIDGYRADRHASFESYALLRIRGSILDAVRSLDTIGRAGREAGRAIQAAIGTLQEDLGREPTELEVSSALGLSLGRYREQLQVASRVTVSLQELADRNDDDGDTLSNLAVDADAVDPADALLRQDEITGLAGAIGRLGERQQLVLALYYQDELTFREIGAVLRVTESRVCQIHTEALLALRARLGAPPRISSRGRRAVA
jgi:RNA polymerase sigma factor FliA